MVGQVLQWTLVAAATLLLIVALLWARWELKADRVSLAATVAQGELILLVIVLLGVAGLVRLL